MLQRFKSAVKDSTAINAKLDSSKNKSTGLDIDISMEKQEEKKKSTSKSVELFLKHREDEIGKSLQLIEDFMTSQYCSTHSTSLSVVSEELSINKEEFELKRVVDAHVGLFRFLSHVLYFGSDGMCDFDLSIPMTQSKV